MPPPSRRRTPRLRGRGFSLYLVNTNGKAREEADAIDLLQHGRVDGLIMTINSEQDARTLKRLEELRVPSVLLDREISLDIDAVLTDHALGMTQATEHLIDLGHRRIALITGGVDIRPGRERVRGFKEAFRRRRLACPEDLIHAHSLSADFGFRAAFGLLQRSDRPTAIIAAGNRVLVGVLRAIQQQNVSVPGDISIIGCDQTDLARLYPGPITLIDRDIEEIGRMAAQLLLERLVEGSERPAQRISFPTRLILGGSCAPVPCRVGKAKRAHRGAQRVGTLRFAHPTSSRHSTRRRPPLRRAGSISRSSCASRIIS